VARAFGHGTSAVPPLEDVAADHTDAAITRALTSCAGRTVGAASIVLVSGTVVATSTGSSHPSMLAAPHEPPLTAIRETPEKLPDRQRCEPNANVSPQGLHRVNPFEMLAGVCMDVWLRRTRFHLRWRRGFPCQDCAPHGIGGGRTRHTVLDCFLPQRIRLTRPLPEFRQRR
jgi:hypothetical protein